jgi:hypothetical protein
MRHIHLDDYLTAMPLPLPDACLNANPLPLPQLNAQNIHAVITIFSESLSCDSGTIIEWPTLTSCHTPRCVLGHGHGLVLPPADNHVTSLSHYDSNADALRIFAPTQTRTVSREKTSRRPYSSTHLPRICVAIRFGTELASCAACARRSPSFRGEQQPASRL